MIFDIQVLSRDNDRVLTNAIATCSITWLILIFSSLQVFYDADKKIDIEIRQPSLCYSLMTSTSCELGHVVLTSTQVPILLSEYKILSEHSPNIGTYLFQP